MRYKLAIVHRVCPWLAKTAAVYENKLNMVKDTTASLAQALTGIRTKLIVVLDGCGMEYEALFDMTFKNGRINGVDYECIKTSAIGNNATYRTQLELMPMLSDIADYLYFSEDDYIYKENAFQAMMEFLKEPGVDFVSPLDHPDSYQRDREKYHNSIIRHSSVCHWREVGSTCCTFMLKSTTLQRAYKSLSYYANGGADYFMGALMTKKGPFSLSCVVGGVMKYLLGGGKNWMLTIPAMAWVRLGIRLITYPKFRIWSPMPTLAVHLCKPSLPPLSKAIESVGCCK